jgi:hypothetical protein
MVWVGADGRVGGGEAAQHQLYAVCFQVGLCCCEFGWRERKVAWWVQNGWVGGGEAAEHKLPAVCFQVGVVVVGLGGGRGRLCGWVQMGGPVAGKLLNISFTYTSPSSQAAPGSFLSHRQLYHSSLSRHTPHCPTLS